MNHGAYSLSWCSHQLALHDATAHCLSLSLPGFLVCCTNSAMHRIRPIRAGWVCHCLHLRACVTLTCGAHCAGVALYYSESIYGVPPVLREHVAKFPVVHTLNILLTTRNVPVPNVSMQERFLVQQLGVPGFYHIVTRSDPAPPGCYEGPDACSASGLQKYAAEMMRPSRQLQCVSARRHQSHRW